MQQPVTIKGKRRLSLMRASQRRTSFAAHSIPALKGEAFRAIRMTPDYQEAEDSTVSQAGMARM
jgi:hypothetical protein